MGNPIGRRMLLKLAGAGLLSAAALEQAAPQTATTTA